MMASIAETLTIILTLLLAGTVKGVIGMGLPTVTLALLTAFYDLTFAMTIMLMPSLLTNLWQALAGPGNAALVKMLWPFWLSAAATIWLGVWCLTIIEISWLSALLGLLLALYAIQGLAGFKLQIDKTRLSVLNPTLGGLNGLLTGMTGSSVFPGVLYLQALGLPRNHFIKAMGMLFSLSTLALAIAMGQHQLLQTDTLVMSMSGVLPALAGMMLGQRLRDQLPDAVFRTVFFVAVLFVALYILFSASQPFL